MWKPGHEQMYVVTFECSFIFAISISRFLSLNIFYLNYVYIMSTLSGPGFDISVE